MTSPAKSTPYCIYVTSRPSPPYKHRRVNQRSRVLTYSLALPTWPAHAWEIVWKLTSHASQTRKSPVLSRIPLNLSILPRKGRKEGQTCRASYSRTLVVPPSTSAKALRLFPSFFRLSVRLALLSRRNPWNRVTFVRNQAVVSTQEPKLLRDFSLSPSFSQRYPPSIVKSNSSWRINSCRGGSSSRFSLAIPKSEQPGRRASVTRDMVTWERSKRAARIYLRTASTVPLFVNNATKWQRRWRLFDLPKGWRDRKTVRRWWIMVGWFAGRQTRVKRALTDPRGWEKKRDSLDWKLITIVKRSDGKGGSY